MPDCNGQMKEFKGRTEATMVGLASGLDEVKARLTALPCNKHIEVLAQIGSTLEWHTWAIRGVLAAIIGATVAYILGG